jgi:hypothetical protein
MQQPSFCYFLPRCAATSELSCVAEVRICFAMSATGMLPLGGRLDIWDLYAETARTRPVKRQDGELISKHFQSVSGANRLAGSCRACDSHGSHFRDFADHYVICVGKAHALRNVPKRAYLSSTFCTRGCHTCSSDSDAADAAPPLTQARNPRSLRAIHRATHNTHMGIRNTQYDAPPSPVEVPIQLNGLPPTT